MKKVGLGRRLRQVPVLGGIVGFFSTLGDVYDTIGWTDPSYHSIRSSQERLDEARKVGSIGNSAAPRAGQDETKEDPGSSVDPSQEQLGPRVDPAS